MILIDHDQRVISLTNSSRGTFDVCQRKFYFSNLAHGTGIRPMGVPSFALLFGNVAHEMFAAALGPDPSDTAIAAAAYREIKKAEEATPERSAKEVKNLAQAEALASAFVPVATEIAQRIHSEFEVTHVEETRGTLLGVVDNGDQQYSVMLYGKLDVVGHNAAGPAIIDHKTVSRYAEAFYDKCMFDHQLTTYALLTNPDAPRVTTIYNCVRKPALRQKSGESDGQFAQRLQDYITNTDPDEYIKWVRCDRTKERMEEVRLVYTDLATDVLRADRHGFWRQNMGVCDLYSGCEYRHICSGADPDMINFEVRKQAHEELGQESEEW